MAGHTRVENAVIDIHFRQLSASAIVVLVVLKRHCDRKGECYPSMETIAEVSGLSKRTVVSAIAELAKAGGITIEKRRRHGTCYNVYRVRA